MKYTASVSDSTFKVESQPDGAILVDGNALECHVANPAGVVVKDRTGNEFRATAKRDTDGTITVSIENYRIGVSIVRESVARAMELLHVRAGDASGGLIRIQAPMPGLVRKLLVQPGDSVAAGSVLLILEAMKMENEVRSPHAGIVQTVAVAAGVNVEKGRVMLEVSKH